MRKKVFQDLVESIREAGRIHRGEIAPSREFVLGAADIQATGDRLEGMLLEGLDSGKPKVVTRKYWEEKKARLARARKRIGGS